MNAPTSLNNAQLEILQLFASNLSEGELQDLRQILIDFRYRRLQSAIDKLNLNEAQIKEWSKSHDRIPYHTKTSQSPS